MKRPEQLSGAEPRITLFPETILAGKHVTMTFAENNTHQLWRSFLILCKELDINIETDLYSVEVYPDALFIEDFDVEKPFEKWAAVKLMDHSALPVGMKWLTIPEGYYAVFIYKGKAADAHNSYQYIFNQWIPSSEYQLDNRPHFALMGKKYKNDHPDSEEELWIPVKSK